MRKKKVEKERKRWLIRGGREGVIDEGERVYIGRNKEGRNKKNIR